MKQIKQFLLLVAMGCMGTADAQVSEKNGAMYLPYPPRRHGLAVGLQPTSQICAVVTPRINSEIHFPKLIAHCKR